MDGLLVDSEPIWFEVERDVMARLGGDWSSADQRVLIGGSLPRTVGYLVERGTVPATYAQVAGWLLARHGRADRQGRGLAAAGRGRR